MTRKGHGQYRDPDVTPAQAIRLLETDLGLSARDLRVILDVEPRSIARWVRGDAHPRPDARRRLGELMQLHRHLGETFATPEDTRTWLAAPSRYLGGMTPLEAMRTGRADRVEAALEVLDSGIFL